MWEKSKVIVEKINKADCLTNKQLFQVEKSIQLFEAIETIAVLKGKKIEREKIQIPDCESDILKTIEKEACLNEDEFEVVRISLFIEDMWNNILDEALQLDKTDVFEFQHSPYINQRRINS